MKNTSIVAVLASAFVALVGIVAYVTVNGGDVDSIIGLIGVGIAAAVPGVVNHAKINEVKRNTNGTLTALLSRNEQLEQANSILSKTIGQLESKVDDNG